MLLFIALSFGACGAIEADNTGTGEAPPAHVLAVGPGETLKLPSMAARVARDGDTVEIAAGTYSGDAAVWRQNDLTIRGINGRAHLKADGAAAEGKAIWVIKGKNTTVESIEFSTAKVADQNGAGIRQEGPGLTVRNCYFHDNEMGILTGANPDSEIVIERSEFANSGIGAQRPSPIGHNVYIGAVKRFTLRASYSHHARIGHNVKSRALENFILYNRIMDEQTGTASYEVDLPNGGLAYLIGNVLQKGPRAENRTIVSYGAEGLRHPVNELYVVSNTMVSDYPGSGRFVFVAPGTEHATVIDNVFAGSGALLAGRGDTSHNLQSNDPGFVNRAQFDYHLNAGSPAIDAGVAPGSAHGFELIPIAEYVHPLSQQSRPQVRALDLGAYEARR